MTVHGLASRLKRIEKKAGMVNEVEAILDSLDGWQSEAILLHLIAILRGEEGPSDVELRATPLQPRTRYEQVLASIPKGTFERLLAAFLERVTRKEAA